MKVLGKGINVVEAHKHTLHSNVGTKSRNNLRYKCLARMEKGIPELHNKYQSTVLWDNFSSEHF